ncbi:hypothetical protein [Nonomuraea sediminis]|uniref:hypothetical protein n=1 Tax=Nonomuraea sediminis TaxID=2835864 RepID=UPI001BDCFB34|nr:hypothetical protein [Nonomuraea sediminis]
MADISLIDAWGLWLDGKSTLGYSLFGIPMVWIGRAGKIVSFLSALAVVLEIVGVERLPLLADLISDLDDRPGETPMIAYIMAYGFIGVLAGTGFAVWRIIGVPFDKPVPGGGLILGFGFIVVPLILGFGPRAMAWLLGMPWFPTAVRVLSFLTLAIGFHFDLLAS